MRMVSIYILEILATYSSSDHRLYQKEIQGYLQDVYRVEISRRTLQTHIDELKVEGYIDGHKGVYLIENKFNNISVVKDGEEKFYYMTATK